MLDSVPPIAELLLSSGESLLLLSDAMKNASFGPGNTVVTPQEPSTLALALAGIATLAVYYVASGMRRANPTAARVRSRPRRVAVLPQKAARPTPKKKKRRAA